MNHPLVQPRLVAPLVPNGLTAQTKEPIKDSGFSEKAAVNSVPAKLPSLWKPKNNAVPEIKSEAPTTDKNMPVIAPLNNTTPPTIPTRRKLPDEIKKIFETNSTNFAAYAKNGKQETILSLNKTLDEWDRALLLEEYRPALPERQKPKRLSFIPTPAFVPKKNDLQEIGAAFPSRVMDEEVASPVLRTEPPITAPVLIKPISTATPAIPQKPQNVLKNTLGEKNTVPNIPLKPKQSPISTTRSTNPLPLSILNKDILIPLRPVVPQKTVSQGPERPSAPPPNMSETLVEKIIEGQMRGVFDNAPPLLQKELEKAIVKEIIAPTNEKAPRDNIENEVWKKRLREYLTKLHEQAVSVFPDTNMANPTEGEFVLDYVKRVYPILLKAQVMKQ